MKARLRTPSVEAATRRRLIAPCSALPGWNDDEDKPFLDEFQDLSKHHGSWECAVRKWANIWMF